MSTDLEKLPTIKVIKSYLLLNDLLKSQKVEFDLLSKKKADDQLNPMKIKLVNRVLEPLKKIFQYEDSHEFLDILDKDDMPTTSDVVLIISQYESAVKNFKDRYYKRDNKGQLTWITQETYKDFVS